MEKAVSCGQKQSTVEAGQRENDQEWTQTPLETFSTQRNKGPSLHLIIGSSELLLLLSVVCLPFFLFLIGKVYFGYFFFP